MKPSFRVHIDGKVEQFTEVELGGYAERVGLAAVAPGRWSWLFAMQLLLHERQNGVDPSLVVAELQALEGQIRTVATKPATQFSHLPLKGLWHKHFFSAHFVPHNLVMQHSRGRLEKLVERVLDPEKHSVVTPELLDQLTYEIVHGALEQREADNSLTGEWIVFAKHEGQNYYLSIALHNSGDQSIFDQIESVCFPQFPALRPIT